LDTAAVWGEYKRTPELRESFTAAAAATGDTAEIALVRKENSDHSGKWGT
jgi:hypothetical protein